MIWAGIEIIIKTLYPPSPIRVRRMGEGREGGQQSHPGQSPPWWL